LSQCATSTLDIDEDAAWSVLVSMLASKTTLWRLVNRPDRSAVSAARYRFQAFCADRPHLPELAVLAETVDQWWDGIENYIKTGITNAASEGNNRVIKLEARKAYGFRNRENQRLRPHCATTRRARGKLTIHQL
jgi:transposase